MEWKQGVFEPEGTLGIVRVHPVLNDGETEAQRGEPRRGVMPFPAARATSLLPLEDQTCPDLDWEAGNSTETQRGGLSLSCQDLTGAAASLPAAPSACRVAALGCR